MQASSQAVERAISLSTAREAVRQPISMDALLHQVADADSPARSARRWPRRIFPMPFRAGANDCFDENRRSHAEGGTGRRNETSAPTGHREGNRGRVRITTTDRTRKIRRKADRAFRGPKRGYQHEYCGNIAIRTLWRQVAEAIARQPKSNLSPALATTYSRTVRSAPHPPDGRGRTKAPAACWGLRLLIFPMWSSSGLQHVIDARPADADRLGDPTVPRRPPWIAWGR